MVKLVCTSSRAAGLAAEVSDRPDRSRKTPGYTIDAELNVSGVRWAMDIMTLRWSPRLESRVSKLAAQLEEDLSEEIRSEGLVMVGFWFSLGIRSGQRMIGV